MSGWSGGQQRGRWRPCESGFAGGGHVVEHVAPLHPQRGDDRENALYETAAVRAVGTEAGLAPHHAVADPVLAGVVCRLDAFDVGEGPERGLQLQDLAASACNGLDRARGALLKPGGNMRAEVLDEFLERGPCHGAIAHAMPNMEHR